MSNVVYQSSYGFRFKEGASELPCKLTYVGQDLITSNYSWKGLTREDRGGPYLFQYTLSGNGKIRIGKERYSLKAGNAFFVPFRSDYHYYMPRTSQRYESIFVSLDGTEAAKCCDYLTQNQKQVISLSEQSGPVRVLKHILQEASNKQITDAYKSSYLAYQFIMELYRFCKGFSQSKVLPDIVVKAIQILDERHDQPLKLDDISLQLGISKYHFIKLFHQTTGKTPIQYLTKIRIEKAMEMLRYSQHTLEEVSQKTGFSNANYFTKVFRKYIGVPPGQFRNQHFPDQFMFD